jgi:predicted acetyltransferase
LILALALEKARQLGIPQARITCDTDYIGSVLIIEKNGGVLAGHL